MSFINIFVYISVCVRGEASIYVYLRVHHCLWRAECKMTGCCEICNMGIGNQT